MLPNHWQTVHRQTILQNHWQPSPHTESQFCQIAGTALSTDRQFCQITGTTCNTENHWHTSPHTDNSAKLSKHWHRQFCQITGTLLHIHIPPGNSAKSLAHCPQVDNFATSLAHSSTHRQFCKITVTHPHTGSSAKLLAPHCPQRDNSAKSLTHAMLPYHWHAPPHTGNSSAKSLAHCPQTAGNSGKSLAQAILPNHWHRHFCKITGTLSTDKQFRQITDTRNAVISLACSSTYRKFFCRITATLSTDRQFCQITGTGISAKSLAHCPQTDNSAKSLAQAILPNHWHAPPHTGYAAKSLACSSTL